MMTSDLVKRLRDYAIIDYLDWGEGYELMREAAQHIEDLEDKLEDLLYDISMKEDYLAAEEFVMTDIGEE